MYCKLQFIVFCSVILAASAAKLNSQHNDENDDDTVVDRKVARVERACPVSGFQKYCTVNVQSYSGYDSSCHGANEGFVKLNGNTVWRAGWCSELDNARGVTIIQLDTHLCTASSVRRFDTHGDESAASAMDNYLQKLPFGAVIVGVTGDEPTAHLGPALETLRSIGVDVRDVQYKGNFAFVLQKGYSFQPVLRKRLDSEITPAKINLRLQEECTVLLQQHTGGTTFFNRSWDEFRNEFGALNGNYWIGNDRLHELTVSGLYKLRVELMAKYDSQWYWAEYQTFRVLDESARYVLWVGGYSGTAGDSLAAANGVRFSTRDRDNDFHCGISCAVDADIANNGGFWYNTCGQAFLNSPIERRWGFTWYYLPIGPDGSSPDKKLLFSRMSLILMM